MKRDTEEPRESETKKIVLGGTERNEDKKIYMESVGHKRKS